MAALIDKNIPWNDPRRYTRPTTAYSIRDVLTTGKITRIQVCQRREDVGEKDGSWYMANVHNYYHFAYGQDTEWFFDLDTARRAARKRQRRRIKLLRDKLNAILAVDIE